MGVRANSNIRIRKPLVSKNLSVQSQQLDATARLDVSTLLPLLPKDISLKTNGALFGRELPSHFNSQKIFVACHNFFKKHFNEMELNQKHSFSEDEYSVPLPFVFTNYRSDGKIEPECKVFLLFYIKKNSKKFDLTRLVFQVRRKGAMTEIASVNCRFNSKDMSFQHEGMISEGDAFANEFLRQLSDSNGKLTF